MGKKEEKGEQKKRFEVPKAKEVSVSREKPKVGATPTRNRDIEGFKCRGRGHIASQCPNKRVMLITDSGEFETEGEIDDDMPPLEDCSDVEVEGPVHGEMLVARRALSIQPGRGCEEEQQENLFYTRCHVDGKVCSMVIDNGSCTNVASTLLVGKLNLNSFKHPKPYKL